MALRSVTASSEAVSPSARVQRQTCLRTEEKVNDSAHAWLDKIFYRAKYALVSLDRAERIRCFTKASSPVVTKPYPK